MNTDKIEALLKEISSWPSDKAAVSQKNSLIDWICSMQDSNCSDWRKDVEFIAAAPEIISSLLTEIKQKDKVIEAAKEYKEGYETTQARVQAFIDGQEFAIDELDEMDVEEVLARLALINALNELEISNG